MGWVSEAIGGVAQLGGALRQSELDKKTAAENQIIADYQAQDALNRGAAEEMKFRRQIAQFIGSQRNAIGARNVEASGSALRLMEDSAQLGAEDITTIRNNAAREAWGYKTQANEQSRFLSQSAANERVQGGASALTSGIRAYGMWRQAQGE